jgi:RNA polymerase sigma-70 factor (ECF subfamily)
MVGRDAEDVASETWLQIVRDLHGFEGDGDAFRGWAASIARHRALDHVRYHQRRPAVSVSTETLVDRAARDDTPTDAVDALASERVLALVQTLPPEQAEAVLLRVIIGLDAKSAARVLRRRPGAVRMASWRGLRRLAEIIDENSGELIAGDPVAGIAEPVRPKTPVQRRSVTQSPTETLKGTT